jgi:periplasmic protein TonB
MSPFAYLILAAAQAPAPGVTFSNTVPPPAAPALVLPPHSVPPAAIQATGTLTGPREQIPPQRYFSPAGDDYPAAAEGTGAHGTVRFTLTIDPSGRVVGCTIVHSSGSAVLDEATCKIMTRRARYTPAMDSNGQPVAGTITQDVVWKAPR